MATEMLTLQEIVKQARGHLSRGDWDYLVGGAESETSVKRNRLAFDRLALKARVMNDVSQVHVRRTLLGVDQRIRCCSRRSARCRSSIRVAARPCRGPPANSVSSTS